MLTGKLTAQSKSGQSVLVLAALLLIPVAWIIQSSLRNASDTLASSVVVAAATDAAIAAANAATGGGAATGEDIAAAACRAMDVHLPAYLVSIGATPSGVNVVTGYPSEIGEFVASHSYAVEWDGSSRGTAQGAADLSFSFSGADLAGIPACVGRSR